MLELNYTNYINSQTRIPFSVKKTLFDWGSHNPRPSLAMPTLWLHACLQLSDTQRFNIIRTLHTFCSLSHW